MGQFRGLWAKGLSGRLSFVWLFFTALAGAGCDKVNEGMVQDSEPDSECDGCYLSRVDNPQVSRWVNLYGFGKDAMGKDDDTEYAKREEHYAAGVRSTWNYFNFDLDFKTWGGDPATGAVNTTGLYPQPDGTRLWEPAHESTIRMPWNVRGIELGYSLLNATATQYDLYGLPTDVPAIPVRVRLHPDTILVPIQVVRVLPPQSSQYYNLMLDETYEVWKGIFDDRPSIERYLRVSESGGKMNRTVNYREHYVRQNYARPDEIFAQCGIQFRMIDCQENKRGCPDLHVEDERFVAPKECYQGRSGPTQYPEVKSNWSAAKDLPGIDPVLPILVLMHRAENECPSASALGVARTREAMVATGESWGAWYTLAHELGHLLGLKDKKCDEPKDKKCDESKDEKCDDSKGLMCEYGKDAGDKLSDPECRTARKAAAQYARHKWGVVIDAERWER